MPEFVNPKYADAARTTFKKPTRIESLMQDYPKSLAGRAPPAAYVVFSLCSSVWVLAIVKRRRRKQPGA